MGGILYNIEIKKAREKKKLTQKQLADGISVTQTMVSKYETGIRFPSRGVLLNIKMFLGLEIEPENLRKHVIGKVKTISSNKLEDIDDFIDYLNFKYR